MKIPLKIISFLEKEKIKYRSIEHKTVYTAFDKAATLRIDPKFIAKCLVVKGDNEFFLAVIPGNKNLDKEKLKKAINSEKKKNKEKAIKKIDFAAERWIQNNLKGIKVGAIPVLGKLFDMPVFADSQLLKNNKIYISAGNYENSIIITPAVFKKITSILTTGSFSAPKPKKKKSGKPRKTKKPRIKSKK